MPEGFLHREEITPVTVDSDAYFSYRRGFSVLPMSDIVQGIVARAPPGTPDEVLGDARGRGRSGAISGTSAAGANAFG